MSLPDELARRLDGVEGWLHDDEAGELCETARHLSPRDEGLTVVEIGSWKGRSTISLATGLEIASLRGTVFAVDPHTGNVEHRQLWGEVDTFGEFVENIERAGVADLVVPLRMTSHEASAQFVTAQVDLLFIDGSHEYDDVRRDIDDWLPLLREGAAVVFNDASWPGVYRALRERVLAPAGPFHDPRLVRSTLYLDYAPGVEASADSRRRWRALRATLAIRRASHRLVPLLPDWAKRGANAVTSKLAGARR